jgi:hypothetical protein
MEEIGAVFKIEFHLECGSPTFHSRATYFPEIHAAEQACTIDDERDTSAQEGVDDDCSCRRRRK